MIVITGVTSNTGRAVAARLLDEGRTVRVGGRSVARLRRFVEREGDAYHFVPDLWVGRR
jgi:NADP-dependent 3-hydroxy acid dehydrogenase YdfG